mgnify:CR=1 FL=1|tara:strand:- start:55 stop:342 length:288 start_codon:yes stop_codon:yes gene_type:complete
MQVRAWWRRSRLRHWLVMNDERIGAWPFAAIIVVSVAALLLGADIDGEVALMVVVATVGLLGVMLDPVKTNAKVWVLLLYGGSIGIVVLAKGWLG